jgi:hypothetical protein
LPPAIHSTDIERRSAIENHSPAKRALGVLNLHSAVAERGVRVLQAGDPIGREEETEQPLKRARCPLWPAGDSTGEDQNKSLRGWAEYRTDTGFIDERTQKSGDVPMASSAELMPDDRDIAACNSGEWS